jgi:hypothetical protein
MKNTHILLTAGILGLLMSSLAQAQPFDGIGLQKSPLPALDLNKPIYVKQGEWVCKTQNAFVLSSGDKIFHNEQLRRAYSCGRSVTQDVPVQLLFLKCLSSACINQTVVFSSVAISWRNADGMIDFGYTHKSSLRN